MNTIVLAYSGGFASSNAIHWLRETHDAEVVTVTLDVGQGEDLGAIRARALSCGAVRAHAIAARDALGRESPPPARGARPRVPAAVAGARPARRRPAHRRVHAPPDRTKAPRGGAHRGDAGRRARL